MLLKPFMSYVTKILQLLVFGAKRLSLISNLAMNRMDCKLTVESID